ncbi:triggering receptor expressed on myeloid cells 1 [Rhynchocyon petersi]
MASRQKLQKWDRMRETGLWKCPWLLLLLLLLLCVPGFQAVNIREERKCLIEGNSLDLICPYNINEYAPHPKAWQRVKSQGRPETLVRIETEDTSKPNRVQVGRYLLEDFPRDGILKVMMTGLRRQDEGLYQCVVDLSPKDPFVLHDRIRLVLCNAIPPLATARTIDSLHPGSTTVTQPFFSSVSSPGLNFTNNKDVTRVSVFSIVVPVVCGILSKSVIFTVLLAVTQRSAAR